MPSVVTVGLRQDGAIYPFSSVDSHVRPLVNAAIDIKCKLENVTKNQLSPSAEVITSDAICYVDTTITVGSIFRLGTVASIPDTPNNLFEVMEYDELQNIVNKTTMRWVLLNRWNKVLPTIE